MQPLNARGKRAPSRHTPEPAKVVLAMTGLLILGVLAGGLGALLPLWAFDLSLDSTDAGNGFLALGFCALASGIGAVRYGKSADKLRKLFFFGALLAAACFLGTAGVGRAGDMIFPLAGTGVGAGVVVGLSAALLEECLTDRRASDVLHLAGVSFGFGAIGACLLAWLLNASVGSAGVSATLAGLMAAAAITTRLGRPVSIAESAPRSFRGALRDAWTPGGVLLGAGAFVQAANSGIAGSWLGLYVFRRLGVSLEWSLAILIGFWAAVTSARVLAARIPPRAGRVLPALGVTAVSLLGALFLMQTVQASGALVGALLLGAGVGAAHPLMLGAMQTRLLPAPTGLPRLYAAGSLLAALFCAWAIGPLSNQWGIDVVVWILLLGGIGALAILVTLVIESRFSPSPASAR